MPGGRRPARDSGSFGAVSTRPGATDPPAHSATSWAVRSAPIHARRDSCPFSKRLLASERRASRCAVRRMLTGSNTADSITTSVVASEISEVAPPMTPGNADRALGVGDEQHVGRELALDVVEGLEALPGDGAADDDRGPPVGAGVDRGGIERVDRLAELEHHVVRGVDDVRDGTLARGEQAHLHPVRRRGDGHAAHPAADEARAQVGVADVHREALARRRPAVLRHGDLRHPDLLRRSPRRPRAPAPGSTARPRGWASRPRRGCRRRTGRRAARPAACPRAGSGSRRRRR